MACSRAQRASWPGWGPPAGAWRPAGRASARSAASRSPTRASRPCPRRATASRTKPRPSATRRCATEPDRPPLPAERRGPAPVGVVDVGELEPLRDQLVEQRLLPVEQGGVEAHRGAGPQRLARQGQADLGLEPVEALAEDAGEGALPGEVALLEVVDEAGDRGDPAPNL